MKKFNHFNGADAGVNIRRSVFQRDSSHKGTMPTGKLIPLFVDEVLPGDTKKITVSSVIRGATPLAPVMDNAFLDIACFFVPYRLVYDDWQRFMGENDADYWASSRTYLIPRTVIQTGVNGSSDIASKLLHTPIDYMGCIGQLASFSDNNGVSDSGSFTKGFNALYGRSMCKCWNDWYRNQNTQSPCHIYTDGVDRSIRIDGDLSDYVVNGEYGVTLLPVNKFKDYYTSSLPAPQKHAPISLPLGDFAPIENTPLAQVDNTSLLYPNLFREGGSDWTGYIYNSMVGGASGIQNGSMFADSGAVGVVYPDGDSPFDKVGMALRANLSQATATTVNQLRLAFQTQKFYEKQALYGSRYTELIYSMFGVYTADSRLQRAEFINGKRIPIHQYQVNQTLTGADGGVLGKTGAFSLTNDKSLICNRSFTEHGTLMIFGYVRTFQSYSQGQERMFARRELFDYYFPVFAHIGETPVYNKELLYGGSPNARQSSDVYSSTDDEVFGYQEAYAEYRYKPNRISGYLRPEVPNSLAFWHYGTNFANRPVLNSAFTSETDLYVKRSMAVDSEPEWIFDISFTQVDTRPMPIYSVPGLIDHF